MSAPRELVKGHAAALVLSCIAREPMHGYRIAKELERLSEGYFVMREGTLYPQLHELEKEGCIEGYWETAAGKRERKVYRITEKGTRELAHLRGEWEKFQSKVSRVLGLAPETAAAS